jgi:L-ribulose-5-phosphate 3-epimerase
MRKADLMNDREQEHFMSELGRTRRRFLGTAAAACGAAVASPARALPLQERPAGPAAVPRGPFAGKLCFFTKPLPEMDWRRLSRSVKQLGFDGLDLTVRPGGHVLPEKAAADLPRAVATAREEGLDVPMITTALTSADEPTARPILSTAGKLGIPYFKVGYYLYEHEDVRAELARAGRDFGRLVQLAVDCGVQAGFHNHSEYVGAALWDAASFIEPLDPTLAGYYFDARHATAEGGAGAWKTAVHLVKSRLKMMAVKDFSWVKTARGWQDANCPLGEGMVDWKYVLGELCPGFQGPISLHMEYEVPGATTEEHEQNILAAAARDLAFLKKGVRS